jgi:prephenate dehydrogenase
MIAPDRVPNIAIIGIGLIGSSIALAARQQAGAEVITLFDLSEEVRAISLSYVFRLGPWAKLAARLRRS